MFFLINRGPPSSTRTDPRFPDTTHFRSYGSDTTWSLGMVWSPMQQLTFKVNKATSFVAPTPRDGLAPTIVFSYGPAGYDRSEEHTSELQSLMRISYAVFCLQKKIIKNSNKTQKNKINTIYNDTIHN